jgi:GTP-binding protein
MLADRAKICVRGGHGGNGSVSFRREKYVPKGGPDGGDGGCGGDVVLIAGEQTRDLSSFLHKIHYIARSGVHGSGARKQGADGAPLRVEVPPGTEIRTLDGELVADLVRPGSAVLVAAGGEGGRGNACFASSTRRAPRFAEHGLPGEERWLLLRMKLLADVGLVGLPNAGKSSLLAAVTRARPKIASYPFTTVEPNLGVLTLHDGRSLVLADIPGLIEGASRGVGLGDEFLAHVERTRALLYVVDGSEGPDGAVAALRTVHAELVAFEPSLVERGCAVALSKSDLAGAQSFAEVRSAIAAAAPDILGSGEVPLVAVSSVAQEGLDAVVAELGRLVPAAVEEEAAVAPAVVLRPGGDRTSDFSVERRGDAWVVRGAALERLVGKADLDNDEAVAYLQQVMERAGVFATLRRAGAVPGDTVLLAEREFEFS